jgi:hypothetical protein
MSGAEELLWMVLGSMVATTFIAVWVIVLAKIMAWVLPKIFPELKL